MTSLNDLDWVISPHGARLHHVALTPERDAQLTEDGLLPDGAVAACGWRLTSVAIPGVFSRLHVRRCAPCCDALGYPRGVGSPKNDPACRALLGLPT